MSAFSVGVDLGEGQPGAVVDGGVNDLPAGLAAAVAERRWVSAVGGVSAVIVACS